MVLAVLQQYLLHQNQKPVGQLKKCCPNNRLKGLILCGNNCCYSIGSIMKTIDVIKN
jgi:hypothetical protein